MIAVPEPELTEREVIERAVAMRPALLERQPETERLTIYPKDTHEEFLRAGFYRMLQPRRYGGYAFGLPTFYRVVTEVARGCPPPAGPCLSPPPMSSRSPRSSRRRRRTNSSVTRATSGRPPPRLPSGWRGPTATVT
ncbi:hypothetical protein HEP84_55905 [Streptomyces sp. RLB1-33]